MLEVEDDRQKRVINFLTNHAHENAIHLNGRFYHGSP